MIHVFTLPPGYFWLRVWAAFQVISSSQVRLEIIWHMASTRAIGRIFLPISQGPSHSSGQKNQGPQTWKKPWNSTEKHRTTAPSRMDVKVSESAVMFHDFPIFHVLISETWIKKYFTSSSPPWHLMLHICSHILTSCVIKSGEDEEERKTLMKSRALGSLGSRFHQSYYPLLLVPGWGPPVTILIWNSTFNAANLWTFFPTFYLTYLLTVFLAFYLAYSFWHLLTFFLAYLPAHLLTFFLAYLGEFFLAYIFRILLAYFLACLSRILSGTLPAAMKRRLAVEVRRCPLRWRAGEEKLASRGRRRRRRRRWALIKSNNPHLTGGENMEKHPP